MLWVRKDVKMFVFCPLATGAGARAAHAGIMGR